MDRIASPEFVRRVSEEAGVKLVVRSQELVHPEPSLASVILEELGERCGSGQPYAGPEFSRDDPVEIVYTSGTTSEPKGVVISHGNILANLEPLEKEISRYRKYQRIFHPLRFLNMLPLSHVFGQFLGILVPPLLAGTVVFQGSYNPSEIVGAIKKERVSVLVGVPRLMESLRAKIERDLETKRKLGRFRKVFAASENTHFLVRGWRFRSIHNLFGWKFWAFVCGGATLEPEAEEFWRRSGFAVIQGYGLTETTSLLSVNHPFELARGSIGKLLPGREVKLGESGEVLVRGSSVAAGYWQGREIKPVLDDQGWLHTGDRIDLDASGHLYFKGRTKQVIVTPDGMNVYPEDLEAALRRQPEVRDAVVVGFERGGNAEPCAVLILKDSKHEPEVIIRRANQTLASYQQIRRWTVWPEEDFPRSAIQKPRTQVIQQVVQAQLAGKGQVPGPAGAGTLAELIREVTGRTPLSLAPDARLETDLNLSSLDRVELLSALEDRYQVDLNETKFATATTVAELEQMLREPPPARSDYHYPHWALRWPVIGVRWAVYYLLSWPATLVLGYPGVRGQENLRSVRAPVLVVSNHVTAIDIGFILPALPARFRHHLAVAMIGERLRAMRRPPATLGFFRRGWEKLQYGLVVALFNVFPLPQHSGFRESFAYAGECVDRGYSVLVFPEGHRTEDGKLATFRSGIGLLAGRLEIPIVPVRIDGLFELKKAGKRIARPGAVKVNIGEPVRYGPTEKPEAIARDLERRVADLAWSTSSTDGR